MSINPRATYITSRPKPGTKQSEHVESVLGARALAHIDGAVGDFLCQNNIHRIVLAGGALMKGPAADLDFFPSSDDLNANRLQQLVDKLSGTTNSDFAETSVGSVIVQLCIPKNIPVVTLDKLLSGFDFAHCQVAVELRAVHCKWVIVRVEMTPAWKVAMVTQGTFYTAGGNWPLRSLARVPKIAAKLGLTKTETQDLVFQVTAEIAKRGIDKVIADDPSFAAMMGVGVPT